MKNNLVNIKKKKLVHIIFLNIYKTKYLDIVQLFYLYIVYLNKF